MKPFKLYPVPTGAIGECRSCGARVVWGQTENGKNVPLSYDHPAAKRDADGHAFEAPSHFVDCPNASGHSRKNAPGHSRRGRR